MESELGYRPSKSEEEKGIPKKDWNPGDIVNVQRSDNTFEKDWTLLAVHEDEVVVTKRDPSNPSNWMRKFVPTQQFETWQINPMDRNNVMIADVNDHPELKKLRDQYDKMLKDQKDNI